MTDNGVTKDGSDPVDLNLSDSLREGSPEDRELFRLAQLLLFFEVSNEFNYAVPTVDRLGYYDFFAANPFVVVSGDGANDEQDRLTLRLTGFNRRQLNYSATGQRFASRRKKLQHDLAILVSLKLVHLTRRGYEITSQGAETSGQLTTVYSDAYREASRIVLRRLRKMSDKQLTDRVRTWLGASWLLIDFTDDVEGAVPDMPDERGGEQDG